MPEINGQTLMMAVQAVNVRINALAEEADRAEGLEARDLEDLLMSYMSAATALRKGYEEALKLSSNLPPYDELVHD